MRLMSPLERRWVGPSFGRATDHRTRIVVEGGDPAERWIIVQALEDVGFTVAACRGPLEEGGPCPLVLGHGCPAVEAADAVVNLLGVRSDHGADVLRAVRGAAPAATIVAVATPHDSETAADLLDECRCEPVTPFDAGRMVRALNRRSRRREP